MAKSARSATLEKLIEDVDAKLAGDGYKRVTTCQKDGTVFAQYFCRNAAGAILTVFEDTADGVEAIIYRSGETISVPAGDEAMG